MNNGCSGASPCCLLHNDVLNPEFIWLWELESSENQIPFKRAEPENYEALIAAAGPPAISTQTDFSLLPLRLGLAPPEITV